jgi:type I restriction enzyme S subunit
MAGEWRDVALEDVADELTVGYVGPMASEYVDEGIPFLRSLNVDPLRINKNDLKFITPEFHSRIRKSRLTPGDVVIVRTGKPGSCSVVPEWLADANCSDLVIVRCGPQLDNRFLAYYVNTVAGDHVAAHLVGAVQQHFNVGSARTLRIKLPPLAEQKAIAAVLGALDDKIELNRRMNATLEGMARALFQSWFVDFDPVRTKLDGRQPDGLDPDTASLFPDSFQDSEAGHIPKGWTVGKVSDLATLNRGAVNPGDFPSETFDHYSLPAFDNGRTPKVELGSAIMSNKFTVTPNSVLLSKLNPHIPRIWLPDLHASRRSVCSTEFMVACSKSGVSREYLFSLFTSSAFASIYGTLVTGTTGSHQRIRPEGVLEMKIVIPPPSLIRAFTDIAKPMFGRFNRNTEQSRTLATLRDTLLPKLLSGDLSVMEFEKVVSA